MASPPTTRLSSPADWTLMDTIHDALRRDLDQLLHTTASRTAVRARWVVFRDQLHLHLAAEQAAMWPLARAKLTGERLATRLTSHLAHEEADALPLIGQIMSQHELGAIGRAIRGGPAAGTLPWALASASPHVCAQVLSQLPAPGRLLYRRVWLPRHTRNTPSL